MYHWWIFLPFTRLSLILLLVFFAVQKLFNLMQSHLVFLNLFYFSLCEEIYQKKILPREMSQSLLPVLSSRSFNILGLTFRPWINSEFSFTWREKVAGCRVFARVCPILPTPLIEKAVFTPLHVLPPLSNTNWPYSVSLFLGCLFCPLVLRVCFYAGAMLFWLL